MAVITNQELTHLLLKEGLITEESLQKALQELNTTTTFESLVIILQKNKFVDEVKFIKLLGEKMGLPTVFSLSLYKMDPRITKMVVGSFAEKYHLMPLYRVKDNLIVAMADPLNLKAISELENKFGCRVEPVLAPFSEIKKMIGKSFGVLDTINEIISSLDESVLAPAAQRMEISETLAGTAIEGPVSRIINLLLTQAVREGASDLHFEPFPDSLVARFRVDGILREVIGFPKSFIPILISSLKIMSRLDIAEKRLPQEGGTQVTIDDRVFNLRIASFPMIHGEKVVVRLLEKEATLLALEQLGFPKNTLAVFSSLIAKPHGIVLVTGPTGAGKTTTLYAVLNKINDVTKNVITIEDPVEYQIESINQSQVNQKAGLTFARALRSFLRQDPDIILVGEIRDLETADIAIQAAQTGHLVFSTLHTNDAAGAITRLIDMGIEPFLISSSLEGVLAQRLVRIICPNCRKPYEPIESVLEWLGLPQNKKYTFYKGTGCKNCNGLGYRGRLGLFELMMVSEDIRNLITSRVQTSVIRNLARKQGMKTLLEEGIQKILDGVTTVEEVMRVCKEVEK